MPTDQPDRTSRAEPAESTTRSTDRESLTITDAVPMIATGLGPGPDATQFTADRR